MRMRLEAVPALFRINQYEHRSRTVEMKFGSLKVQYCTGGFGVAFHAHALTRTKHCPSQMLNSEH